ncbi:hypothetical protein EJ06DRAFT_470998 [Trichodelitschia bisporula]|uniref:Glycosyl transferase CAP10 domain-containing protein n=1 Tax=Trichodelitschia bisporula TaxID=703511 RepID=A0A6G1I6M6_9PEZI|nr:hypothetical protein EJ06DRAFT_470998 [Trichodelitschia bisporula]
MRARQITTAVAIASLVALGLFTLSNSRFANRGADFAFPFPAEPPTETLSPLRVGSTRSHPIDFLVRSAEKEFSEKLDKQSKSLDEAVAEYRRRYRVPPPPHFDVWYQFAKNKDVQLVDEFDSIYHSLLPFWGLDPSVIRARTKEALGGNNVLVGISIRDGQTVRAEGGQEWFQKALLGMMKNFMHNLPDMDLAFNTHDEPRVIVPHDHLTQLLELAQNRQMVAAVYPNGHRNQFSSRPKDMGAGTSIPEVKTTRFNRFAHQPVWTHSRISCPANSPARNFEEVSTDNVTSYAYSDLGFVYNQTAFSDICMSPSLRETYGFFDRPNAFDVTHDLFPIFSQSKISSFQDILYPSPWYWDGKVAYDETKDMEWDAKEARLYWRGSTTGGFSRDGGWRRQHRQRAVRIVNANDEAQILRNRGPAADSDTQTNEPDWQPDTVKRADYASIFDVKFSHVGQCDKHDCDAQREYFDVAERADQQDAWGYKYLLDMDGNAFSGRFYAFLKSNSLVYKMSVFREWHADWLAPWVHYIPLSLKGGDWLEVVRYFAGEEEGKVQGPRLAWQGREWAGKALRNEDFEVWFFRLLLEYGRLIDDNRETIGYPGP